MKILLLAILILYNSAVIQRLEAWTDYDRLEPYVWESEKFRKMALGKNVAASGQIDCEELAARMTEADFDLERKRFSSLSLRFPVRNQKDFDRLSGMYRVLLSDLKCFPIPESSDPKTPDITYENGWMEERSYEGPRVHEGCDIMGGDCPSGFYPVVSMTDGTVEQVGWLPKGGWRIGIRAPLGAYFYYAHLSGYAKGWTAGDSVKAGELLGYMGDSGYGPEGTTGQFPVHLHLGIYVKTEHFEELSVNPYWILKYMEKYRLKAAY